MPEQPTTTPAPAAATAPTPAPAPAAGGGAPTEGAAPAPAGRPTAAKAFEELKARARAATTTAPEKKADPAAPEKKDGDGPAAAAGDDSELEAITRIHEEDRRVKATAKKVADDKAAVEKRAAEVDAEKARLKDAAERDAKIADAKAKGDVIGLLSAIGFNHADIYEGDESLLFKLAELRTANPKITDAKAIEQVVNDKIALKEAEAKAEEERKTKDAEQAAEQEIAKARELEGTAKNAFSREAAEKISGDPAKFPSLVALGVPMSVITGYAWNRLMTSEGKDECTVDEALADMEAHYKEKRRKADELENPKKDEPAAAAPAPMGKPGIRLTTSKPGPNPNWQATTPTPVKDGSSGGTKTLKEKFDELKARGRATAAK